MEWVEDLEREVLLAKSHFRRIVSSATFLTLFLFGTTGAMSQEDSASEAAVAVPEFQLELNSVQNTDAGSCRLTYVASNRSDIALSETAYEVAIFDTDGVVTRLLILEFGALTAGKTKILQFDLAETGCDEIGRIVVNGVTSCVEAEGGASGFCIEGLRTSSRTDIQFGI